MENFYNVNGKKLYVDIIGSKENTPILYIHGAPGVGVADFTAFQKSNFEKDYYLIAPEQRGVWRSQALDDEEGYSIPKIIEDYEEIRKIFGIKKWICITQCSGARTALQYYKNYPEIFAAFVFENPIFDNITIFNEILKLQLKLLKNKFGDTAYSEYLSDARLIKNPLELESFCNKLGRKTDVNMNMILMSIDTAQKMETLKENFDYDYFIKSRATEVKMSHDVSMYGSINEDFNKIKIPTMIIKGAKDVAVPMKVINEFKEKVPQTQLEIFDNCKHWVHLDEPQKYFEKISNFINKNFKEGLN